MKKTNEEYYVVHEIVKLEKKECHYTFRLPSKTTALDHVMQQIFLNFAGGDGENGGEGSLWRCAREIYDTISEGKPYSYTDYTWYVEKDDGKVVITDKPYTFDIEATVTTTITVSAKTLEEAEVKKDALLGETTENLRAALKSYGSSWDYDGNSCVDLVEEGGRDED